MTTTWRISFFNRKVELQALSLPAGIHANLLHTLELIKVYGPAVGMPYTRKLERGLFEIRTRGREGRLREGPLGFPSAGEAGDIPGSARHENEVKRHERTRQKDSNGTVHLIRFLSRCFVLLHAVSLPPGARSPCRLLRRPPHNR